MDFQGGGDPKRGNLPFFAMFFLKSDLEGRDFGVKIQTTCISFFFNPTSGRRNSIYDICNVFEV